MAFKFFLIGVLATFAFVNSQIIEAIDNDFHQNVLDPEACDLQIRTLQSNLQLGMQFLDAGVRIPKGILEGGLTDLGNYHQCLGIDQSADGTLIQGKYCAIRVPMENIDIPLIEDPLDRWRIMRGLSDLDPETITRIEEFNTMKSDLLALSGNTKALDDSTRAAARNSLSGLEFSFGVCIPKPCTTQQAITLIMNVSEVGFNYTESYCRLSGDKPCSGADTAAAVVFSLLVIVTVLSTSYDVIHIYIFKSDDKTISPLYRSFSVYTNGRRLATFNTGPGNLQCMDGIRTIAMTMVITGHTFSSQPQIANPLDTMEWMLSARALWLTTATMTVDTFFTLTGILLVYTTAGKLKPKSLLLNLHWFYVNRLARITPLLAVAVLLQASFLNHMTDGPLWYNVATGTNTCRSNWWVTLLNIQNVYDNSNICISHSWYVAIDIQLYFISPLVLFWVLSDNKHNAWIALTTALVLFLTGATIYNFHYDFQPGVMMPSRGDSLFYVTMYYMNPLTRAAPFFVGLIFGYILHLNRGKKVDMSWFVAIAIWIGAFAVLGSIVYFQYSFIQLDWDNQILDNFMNSFMRPAWACVISWIIFACVHGFGGPINWLLSLDVWRFPARLTYGMYLFHYPLMFSINASMVSPIFFSVGGFTFKALSYWALSLAISYVFTVLVDSPISALFKQLTNSVRPKKKPKADPKAATKDGTAKSNNLVTVQMTTDGVQNSRNS